jgi:hypothetical protein
MKKTAVLLAALIATPASAGTFTPPEGCTAFLTVQSRQCRVSNYYRCAADAPGDLWRQDFDQEGVFFKSKIDSETQWIESYDVNPTVKQTLDPNPEDPASFSDLLATGLDNFAFGLTKETGEQTRVRGFDKLTGKTFTIDGVTLKQTEFEYTETDMSGNVLRRSRGNEFISPEWRTFFAGPSEWDDGTGYVPIDGSPVVFIMPGEPKFATTEPIFDCDVVTSEADVGGPAIVPVAARR